MIPNQAIEAKKPRTITKCTSNDILLVLYGCNLSCTILNRIIEHIVLFVHAGDIAW
jgi:hypothetical protein